MPGVSRRSTHSRRRLAQRTVADGSLNAQSRRLALSDLAPSELALSDLALSEPTLSELDHHRRVVAGRLAFSFLADDLGVRDALGQRG
jgi:hypothetical protein